MLIWRVTSFGTSWLINCGNLCNPATQAIFIGIIIRITITKMGTHGMLRIFPYSPAILLRRHHSLQPCHHLQPVKNGIRHINIIQEVEHLKLYLDHMPLEWRALQLECRLICNPECFILKLCHGRATPLRKWELKYMCQHISIRMELILFVVMGAHGNIS